MSDYEDSARVSDTEEKPLTAGNEKKTGKRAKMIILIISVLLLIGNIVQGIYIYTLNGNYDKLDNTYTSEYLNLNSITIERFYKMVDSGDDFLVYIGRPSCPSCRDFAPGFHSALVELDMLNDVYYLNVQPIRPTASDPGWVAFKERFGEIEGTPSIIHLRGGETVDALSWPDSGETARAWLLQQ